MLVKMHMLKLREVPMALEQHGTDYYKRVFREVGDDTDVSFKSNGVICLP